ncbi:MAG: MltA domain-containing protein [Burkholderiaceae bacterium]
MLAACAVAPVAAPPPAASAAPTAEPASTSAAAPASAPVVPAPEGPGSAGPEPQLQGGVSGATIFQARSRWVASTWHDLPGWTSDRPTELWPALLRGCERPAPGWAALCTQARAAVASGSSFSEDAARAWMEQRLQPYRVEALDGAPDGLITGYFEPLVEASRTSRDGFRFPLYAPPADLGSRVPYWSRQQLDTLAAAQAALRGRELAYLADPLDVLLIQVQGSGRLKLLDPEGKHKLVRVAYAGHNDLPYRSIGRWLIEQGELRLGEASWPAIRQWAKNNPRRVKELLWANPRVVFFREEPLPDPQLGPRGAQAVPLTPQRSVAVDPQSIPYGTALWLDTTEPLSNTPLRRIVMAQDTGSAIVGAVRADFFWGWGDEAEARAGRMKQALRMWVLWPKT